jgi:hypothetical protein
MSEIKKAFIPREKLYLQSLPTAAERVAYKYKLMPLHTENKHR